MTAACVVAPLEGETGSSKARGTTDRSAPCKYQDAWSFMMEALCDAVGEVSSTMELIG